MYEQPPQRVTLPANVPRELRDLPNDDAENKNNLALLKIPLGLRDLLRVFLGRRAHILAQNSEYKHVINLEKGKQPLNFLIYNLSRKKLKIL